MIFSNTHLHERIEMGCEMHEGKVVIENSENYSGYEAWRTNDKVWERFHHIQMSYLGQKATYIECEWEILKHEEAQVDQQYDLQKKSIMLCIDYATMERGTI